MEELRVLPKSTTNVVDGFANPIYFLSAEQKDINTNFLRSWIRPDPKWNSYLPCQGLTSQIISFKCQDEINCVTHRVFVEY